MIKSSFLFVTLFILGINSYAFADCPSLKGTYKRCTDGGNLKITQDFYQGYNLYEIEHSTTGKFTYVEGHDVENYEEFMEGKSLVKLSYNAYTTCHKKAIYSTNSQVSVKIEDESLNGYFIQFMSNTLETLISDYSKTITLNDDGSILISHFEQYQTKEVTCFKK